METGVSNSTKNSEWFPKTRTDKQRVNAQLELILASSHFRQSKRSQALFRYIVAKTMEGQTSILKERTLGVEVFGRSPDYDTNADPIIRMTAGEVRKRIAQYYHDLVGHDEIRIDLPSGSYTAQFHLPAEAGEVLDSTAEVTFPHFQQDMKSNQIAAQDEGTGRIRAPWNRWIVWSAGLILLLLIAGSFTVLRPHRSLMKVVWGEVLDEHSPTLIAVGMNSLGYNPYSHASTGVALEPNSVSASHHMGTNTLSFSEVRALVRLVHLMDDQRKQYNIQPASDTTFADLRQGPSILLGGLNNPWTIRAQQQLRFQVATDNSGLDWIADTRNPGSHKYSVDVKVPYAALTNDYAIVARFKDATTQKPTLLIAGLAEDGTKAASEFITDEEQLQATLGTILQNSKGKNFEVVLGTQVINGVSGPPKILAREIW